MTELVEHLANELLGDIVATGAKKRQANFKKKKTQPPARAAVTAALAVGARLCDVVQSHHVNQAVEALEDAVLRCANDHQAERTALTALIAVAKAVTVTVTNGSAGSHSHRPVVVAITTLVRTARTAIVATVAMPVAAVTVRDIGRFEKAEPTSWRVLAALGGFAAAAMQAAPCGGGQNATAGPPNFKGSGQRATWSRRSIGDRFSGALRAVAARAERLWPRHGAFSPRMVTIDRVLAKALCFDHQQALSLAKAAVAEAAAAAHGGPPPGWLRRLAATLSDANSTADETVTITIRSNGPGVR